MRGLFDKIAQVLGWLDVAEFAIPAKKVSKGVGFMSVLCRFSLSTLAN